MNSVFLFIYLFILLFIFFFFNLLLSLLDTEKKKKKEKKKEIKRDRYKRFPECVSCGPGNNCILKKERKKEIKALITIVISVSLALPEGIHPSIPLPTSSVSGPRLLFACKM